MFDIALSHSHQFVGSIFFGQLGNLFKFVLLLGTNVANLALERFDFVFLAAEFFGPLVEFFEFAVKVGFAVGHAVFSFFEFFTVFVLLTTSVFGNFKRFVFGFEYNIARFVFRLIDNLVGLGTSVAAAFLVVDGYTAHTEQYANHGK